jgi:HAD superfamily hydrolase (TIGR01549 family)
VAKLKAICFDLDLTLLDYDDAEYQKTVACVCRDLAAAHHVVDAEALVPRFWEVQLRRWSVEGAAGGADHASDGFGYWRDTWAEAVAAAGCLDDAIAEHALQLYVQYRHEVYRLYEDVMPVIEALRPDYKLAVITNGPGTTQRDKLTFLQIESLMDVCAISGEAGANKPDAAIFEYVTKRLGIRPEEALHAGDSLSADVAGALGVGMTAVWLNRKGIENTTAVTPHYEVASLRELLEIIASA